MTFELTGPAGHLEARLTLPAGPPHGAAVVAQPHPQFGGSMLSRVVFEAARGFAAVGFAALRFNFRGVGLSTGQFDGGVGEAEDVRAALAALASAYPGVPLVAAGYSFGAWVASSAGAGDPRVAALLAIAPPVTEYDFSALRASGRPTFLIAAERDELTPLKAMQRFYGELPEPRELIVIDGADHVFDGHASEVADAVEDLFADFGERVS